jgi:sporulation protein YlmC with PRC-barrel domain
MSKLLASTAVAALLSLGMSALPATMASADVTATSVVGQPEELIGKNVVDEQGKDVGDIDSVLIDKDGQVKYVIVGVGGFLGIGEKHVAMKWDDLKITENGERVLTNVTKEQLQALPDYKLPENVTLGTVHSYDEAVRMNQYLTEGGIAEAPAAATDTTGTATTDIDNETTVTAGGLRASEVVGADVKNPAGDNIGEISEVILRQDGSVNGVVVDVGGFLGVGDRPVLLNWQDLHFTGTTGGLAVTTTLGNDQLTAFPEFKASK